MITEYGRRLAAGAMLAVAAMLAGCAGGGTLLTGVGKAPESEKADLVKKLITYTTAHYQWNISMGASFGAPKMDRAALKTVKKVAILRYGMNTYAGSKTSTGGDMTFTHTTSFKGDWQPFANKTYDQLKAALEQNGLQVIGADAVTSNADYKAFEVKDAVEYTYNAYGLKNFPAVIKYTRKTFGRKAFAIERATRLQQLAKSLGVDAVMLVVGDIYIRPSGFFNKLTASIPNAGGELSGDKGLMVDMFWAEQPKMIWSAALKKEIAVPVTSKETLMDDFLKNYEEVTQLIALKLKLDKGAD
ncbi:MAG: hypothetical protein NTY45_15820 [Elusimicrobia bacterium]|nr:hypothetical protein [Elusimicrobiota bacterium]